MSCADNPDSSFRSALLVPEPPLLPTHLSQMIHWMKKSMSSMRTPGEHFLLPALSQDKPGRKKFKAVFGCWHTHNEQLIVALCGMIIAQRTFFGAEGVASVKQFIKEVYAGEDAVKPNHIFFDNNCTLAKMVMGDPFFDNIGLSVNIFHFKCKHSQTDTFCQENFNPEALPELHSDDRKGWWFNSSVAEQTNNWFGKYHPITREMNRILPKASHEHGIRHALDIVELAKELPLTYKIGQALPNVFSDGCKECFGRKGRIKCPWISSFLKGATRSAYSVELDNHDDDEGTLQVCKSNLEEQREERDMTVIDYETQNYGN
ncbi:hypothetical protein DFJ58DRAFT_728119 [Suillus subalutaceus]|uniref:uncharacterized protein n=1 Tax=Suillus subalutaceus TaxID=48586 RepID=UPI001B87B6D3|nr:uncharacterized protein DFJ58DRAFT_728119 [Suillus subalutaceus]KAG1853724.1 hypothetical protein DFJ58DRAFT_728119 [Suillus subalutaceus]